MTELKRWERLRELALAHKAWIRTADDAVTDDGRRVSPYPELAEILADYERLREALEKIVESCTTSPQMGSGDWEQQWWTNMRQAGKIARAALSPPPAAGSPEEADAGVAARKSGESSSGGRK